MLLHLEGELGGHAVEVVVDLQCAVEGGDLFCAREVGVDDGADDLGNDGEQFVGAPEVGDAAAEQAADME